MEYLAIEIIQTVTIESPSIALGQVMEKLSEKILTEIDTPIYLTMTRITDNRIQIIVREEDSSPRGFQVLKGSGRSKKGVVILSTLTPNSCSLDHIQLFSNRNGWKMISNDTSCIISPNPQSPNESVYHDILLIGFHPKGGMKCTN